MLLETAYEYVLGYLHNTPFILTLSGRKNHTGTGKVADVFSLPEPPRKVVVRTVELQAAPHLQLNAYTAKQHFTKNIPAEGGALADLLLMLLGEPFTQAHAQTPDKDVYARIVTKNNMESLSTKTTPPSRQAWEQKHDSDKNYLVTPENATELLSALGIVGDNSSIRSAMQAKYRQINHFLSIANQLAVLRSSKTLRIVDCGCGKAYLSLALYHLLTHVQGREVELVGIDTNQHVIDSCNRTAHTLGFDKARFVCQPISSLKPTENTDLLIALHACDTATDDALALALRSKAKAVLAAPCCHHYVNAQLRTSSAPNAAALLLHDGITRERLADLLTDSMRRDVLQSYGYSASLIEFVAPEHTTKNIMIRAEHHAHPELNKEKLQQVLDDMERWSTTPKIMELLGHGSLRNSQ